MITSIPPGVADPDGRVQVDRRIANPRRRSDYGAGSLRGLFVTTMQAAASLLNPVTGFAR